MTDATRFVVLSTQRSGSNWLEDRLDSHPDVVMRRSEPFRKTLQTEDAYVVWRESATSRRTVGRLVPPVAKAQFLQESTRSIHPAVGFRLMYDQLRRNPSLIVSLRTLGFRIVHLVRDNVLDTQISVARAKQSGLYVTRSAGKRPPAVELPTDELVAQLTRRQQLADRHRRLMRRFESIEVSYERYLADPRDHDVRVLEFLGADATVDLGSTFERLSGHGLESKVTNPDEVRRALQDTPFASLAD